MTTKENKLFQIKSEFKMSENSSGNWILIVGFLVIILVMVLYNKYEKRKNTRHLHLYEKSLHRKFSIKSAADIEKFEKPIKPSAKPNVKIRLATYWCSITPNLMKVIWLILSPLSFVIMQIIKGVMGLFIIISEIKFAKIKKISQIRPTLKRIYKRKSYRFAFVLMLFLLLMSTALIKFDALNFSNSESLAKTNKTDVKPLELNRQANKQKKQPAQMMEKDSTKIFIKTPPQQVVSTIKKIIKPIPLKKQSKQKVIKKIDTLEYTLF